MNGNTPRLIGVCTLNCCLSVCPPLRFNGAFMRAARLADAFYSSLRSTDVDIIGLQELVVDYEGVVQRFIHHPFHTSKIESSLFGNNIRLWHAGLAILSRWPILEEDAHIFSGATYNAEAFMAKAVQYSKVLVDYTRIVHVFNTHLQAWTTPRATSIRFEQMRQVAQFMSKKVNTDTFVHQKEAVLLLGDFNIDFFENAKETQEIMNIVQMQMLLPDTPQFSFDPSTNPLVGTDDATEYATKSKLHGCYDELVDSGVCYCCPKQLVDGIAVHLRSPVSFFKTRVVPILSASDFEIYVNMSTRRSVRTVSDHFAVFTELSLFEEAPTLKTIMQSHNRKRAKPQPCTHVFLLENNKQISQPNSFGMACV